MGLYDFGTYNYVADRRYYWPILPLSVFVVYSFALRQCYEEKRPQQTTAHLWYGLSDWLYCGEPRVYRAFFMPGERGSGPRAMLMRGSDIHHPECRPPARFAPVRWPSMAMTYKSFPLRDSLLWSAEGTTQYTAIGEQGSVEVVYGGPRCGPTRLYSLACNRLRAKYLSGPARIVILSFDNGEPQELWNYLSHANPVRRERADCFEAVASPPPTPTLSGGRTHGARSASAGRD